MAADNDDDEPLLVLFLAFTSIPLFPIPSRPPPISPSHSQIHDRARAISTKCTMEPSSTQYRSRNVAEKMQNDARGQKSIKISKGYRFSNADAGMDANVCFAMRR